MERNHVGQSIYSTGGYEELRSTKRFIGQIISERLETGIHGPPVVVFSIVHEFSCKKWLGTTLQAKF
jgi:hypothetical protein